MKLYNFFCLLFASFLVACNQPNSTSSPINVKPINNETLVNAPNSDACLISSDSIGLINHSDTLESIKSKVPNATIKNFVDGDGVDWTTISYSDVNVFVPENDLRYLAVHDSTCKTKEGVAVGITLNELVKVYGNIAEIRKSDANTRQVVIFEKDLAGIQFIGYELGSFADDSNSTKKYDPKAVIETIAVVAKD